MTCISVPSDSNFISSHPWREPPTHVFRSPSRSHNGYPLQSISKGYVHDGGVHYKKSKQQSDAPSIDVPIKIRTNYTNKRTSPFSKKTPELRSVRFGDIEFRKYTAEIGDNPSCMSGPALTIGWIYEVEKRRLVNDYEEIRDPRRRIEELLLTPAERHAMLRMQGFTSDEIEEAVQLKEKCRTQREKTARRINAGKYEESLEGAKRTLRKIFAPRDHNALTNTSASQQEETNRRQKLSRAA